MSEPFWNKEDMARQAAVGYVLPAGPGRGTAEDQKWARFHECGRGLRADDPRFNGWARIKFQDGSDCIFRNAFYVRRGVEIAVFTEHCGYHLFHRGTILRINGKTLR